MAGHSLRVLVPMDQGLREAGPLGRVPGRLLGMLVMRERVRSQPEHLRHRHGGQEDEKGGELSADLHVWILAHSRRGVNGPRPPQRLTTSSSWTTWIQPQGRGIASSRRRA